ncbi:ECF RNA polymerase sigma-E factor [Rosistilla ulvae]|uniref:ECF RNA polymerase sigma-E factor n=1 Tax=Rosistilla ulvae TaxID=1930277 RepID=A0A517M8P5_9BACT|nr:sigma-70 family RNA polymerase sigma factor [Rosistilla ulvae]QDS91255.1 ECF RNA polymerase sigma-E factor [Rosistilla ulvae]
MSETQANSLLVDRIREGDQRAWEDLIDRYEGRLLAFAESRIRNRAASEDIVQEAFIGFLTSLPNYDGARPLESYLFSICAYKLTDHLRREGRRPAISFSATGSQGSWDLAGTARPASSIARSGERRNLEETAVRDALASQVQHWKQRGDWKKLRCLELLFVRGVGNKQVAEELNLTEQQVANYKSDFLLRVRTLVKRMNLDEEVFPELAED